MKYTVQDIENLIQKTVMVKINEQFWNVFYFDEETQVIHLYYVTDGMLLNNEMSVEELSVLSLDMNANVTLYTLQEQLPMLEIPKVVKE